MRADLDDAMSHDDAATAAPRRPFDPGSLVLGLWFGAVGVGAAVAGAERFDDALSWVVPVSFAVSGVALLLPKRQRAAG